MGNVSLLVQTNWSTPFAMPLAKVSSGKPTGASLVKESFGMTRFLFLSWIVMGPSQLLFDLLRPALVLFLNFFQLIYVGDAHDNIE